MNQKKAIIVNLEGIRAHINEIVCLLGVYQQNDVRMRKKNPDVLHMGHVGISLEDGTIVYLYPPAHTEALRDPKEIKMFENKIIRMECKIVPYIPQGRNQEQQACMISSPCIIDLISISAIA